MLFYFFMYRFYWNICTFWSSLIIITLNCSIKHTYYGPSKLWISLMQFVSFLYWVHIQSKLKYPSVFAYTQPYGDSIYFIIIRLKKKNTLSQSLREFFKPTRHAVFYFLFYLFFFTSIGLCLHAHPKPKMTEKFQLRYFHFTRFFELPRAYILPKQQTFFVFRSKTEKKIISRKKNESLNFAKSNAGGSFETQNFFFFSLIINTHYASLILVIPV